MSSVLCVKELQRVRIAIPLFTCVECTFEPDMLIECNKSNILWSLSQRGHFMPPDRMIGGILFLSCLFVCLMSTLTFAITFEP